MEHLHDLIGGIASWIVAVIAAGGYAGIALLMAIESACIPLPSEVIMPFAGYLVSLGKLNLYLVATAGALGCNLGSIPAYELGRWGGRRAIERFGRFVLMDARDLDRSEAFFARFGGLAVLIGRLLPVVRSFIAFPAGIARMNLVRFHIYTFVGSWPFCLALAWIGKLLGDRWESDPRVKLWFDRLDVGIVGLGGVLAIAFVVHRLRKARRR